MTTELYKRFRPKTLERVVGNAETVQSLQSMLIKNTVPHCILLSGPSGTGKTSIARILRKELGCSDIDFAEMNCSSFRGIDTIRDIQKVMDLSPIGGDCRVWLLDEFHQMSKDGQNAALKMLEDTPSHVYFLLCTTDPQKLLPTIRTRCCHMPVSLLSTKELTTLVQRVIKKEAIEVSDSIIEDLVSIAAGSARSALVMLDKIRNLPEEKQLEAMQTRADDNSQAIDLCRALIKKAPWPTVAKILKGLTTEPESVRWAVLGYARSVLLGARDAASGARAFCILRAFENHFFDSKDAGLAASCYDALFGG